MITQNVYAIVAMLWQIFGLHSWEIIRGLWILFALYWLVSALKRKRTKQRESIVQRLGYVFLLAVAFYLLGRPEAHFYPVLGDRFVPDTASMQWIGVLLTAAGIGIAFWARFHLGANWSGTVTLKEGHELIRTGPYRTMRHPIYTGILLAMLGTMLTMGEVRGLIAVGLAWLSFYIKARREESFLSREFGPKFREHQQHTGMFLPRFS
jgi:protein-S-isoprenylcysteine O-methyltransferase Ste14